MSNDQTIQDVDIIELVQKLHIVEDHEDFHQELYQLAPGSLVRPQRIAFVNAHAVNMFYKSRAFYSDVTDCDKVYRDGSGMKILYRLLDLEPGINMNGTDFIPKIVDLYTGYTAALLGTRPPFLDKAAQKISEKGVMVELLMDCFQPDAAYLRAVQEKQPALIILGMGMPKQERVARQLAGQLSYPCLIICGGAILDFLGGKVSRAPALFRKTGTEWVYRLLLEPRRLFRRYVIGNFIFLFRALRTALHYR